MPVTLHCCWSDIEFGGTVITLTCKRGSIYGTTFTQSIAHMTSLVCTQRSIRHNNTSWASSLTITWLKVTVQLEYFVPYCFVQVKGAASTSNRKYYCPVILNNLHACHQKIRITTLTVTNTTVPNLQLILWPAEHTIPATLLHWNRLENNEPHRKPTLTCSHQVSLKQLIS